MSWEKKTIGELCQIEKGKIGIQKAIPGEFPLVVTAEERLSHNGYHFEGNAVVIPLVSSTGHGHRSLKRIHFQSGKFAVGNILCAVIPNDENVLRADYLYRFLDLNREKELVGRMRGMANVTLPIKEIAQIEIPVPPIEAQIDFVEKYSILEEKSNDLGGELTHQLDVVKQLRQALLREAMQGKLVPQNPNDQLASVLLGNIKAEKERLVKEGKIKKSKPLPPISVDEIPFDIPENWVWCRLGEITINHDGLRIPLSKYERSLKQGAFDYFGAQGVIDQIDDYIFDGTYLLIAEDGQNLLRKNKPVAFLAHGKFWVNNHAHVSDCYHDITRFMVANYLNTIDLAPFISGKPPSQIKLKRSALDLIPFPLPPLPEQQRIVAKLDELMGYCDELEASIKASQQQNELLLQQVLREALEPSYATSLR